MARAPHDPVEPGNPLAPNAPLPYTPETPIRRDSVVPDVPFTRPHVPHLPIGGQGPTPPPQPHTRGVPWFDWSEYYRHLASTPTPRSVNQAAPKSVGGSVNAAPALPIIYGSRRVMGQVFATNQGDVATAIFWIALCEGEIDGYDALYVNGLDPSLYPTMAPYYSVVLYTGTAAQAEDAQLFALTGFHQGGFPHTAYAKVTITAAGFNGNYTWQSSLPSNSAGGTPIFEFDLRGRKTFDPRAGGSSYADPSTWTFNKNPFLHWRDLRVSFGGVDNAFVDDSSVIASANTADSTFAGTVRFLSNLVVTSQASVKSYTDQLALACNGYESWPSGLMVLSCDIENAGSPVITLDSIKNFQQIAYSWVDRKQKPTQVRIDYTNKDSTPPFLPDFVLVPPLLSFIGTATFTGGNAAISAVSPPLPLANVMAGWTLKIGAVTATVLSNTTTTITLTAGWGGSSGSQAFSAGSGVEPVLASFVSACISDRVHAARAASYLYNIVNATPFRADGEATYIGIRALPRFTKIALTTSEGVAAQEMLVEQATESKTGWHMQLRQYDAAIYVDHAVTTTQPIAYVAGPTPSDVVVKIDPATDYLFPGRASHVITTTTGLGSAAGIDVSTVTYAAFAVDAVAATGAARLRVRWGPVGTAWAAMVNEIVVPLTGNLVMTSVDTGAGATMAFWINQVTDLTINHYFPSGAFDYETVSGGNYDVIIRSESLQNVLSAGVTFSIAPYSSVGTPIPDAGAVLTANPLDIIGHTTGGLPALSVSGRGRVSYDTTLGALVVSLGGGAYAPVGGAGTVTSVALTMPSIFAVGGSPVTTAGTLAVTLATQSANVVFAGPTSGGAATPTFRSIVAADVPTLNQNTTGTASNVTGIVATTNGGTGVGSFSTANVFFATPNGSIGAPTFRAIVAADIPTLNQNTTGNAATATALQTGRAINGVTFDGTAPITITAAAGTLTGTTLNATVVTSSLTSVGTLGGLTVTAAPTFSAMTAGSVLFAGTAGLLSQDNATFFYSSSNIQLALGGVTGSATLTVGDAGSVPNTTDTLISVGWQSTSSARIVASAAGATTGGGILEFRRARGTLGSPAATQSGDTLGSVMGRGYRVASWAGAERVRMDLSVDETWTNTANGTRITFWTTPLGSSTIAEVVRIDAAGNVGIGKTASTKLDVNGTTTSTAFAGPLTGAVTGNVTGNCSGSSGSCTGNAATATTAAAWTTARNLAGNSVDGSANVAFANKFIVQGTADAGLSAAQFLGALSTGIVKNTTTTGVLSIAIAGDFPTLNQNTTGSAATLTTARAINGTNFDGSAAITITAAAGTLTGTTLNSTVVTSSLTSVGTLTGLTVSTDTTAVGIATLRQASADADSFDIVFQKARGTAASPTVITTGDELGTIQFNGYSGAGGYVVGAAIKAISTGTIATTRVGANLSFWTGTDAAPTVLTERMRIDQAGLVGIGGAAAFKLHVYGGLTGIATTTTDYAAASTGSALNIYHGGTGDRIALIQATKTGGGATTDIELQPNGGNVGIGKTPSTALDVSGTVTATTFVGGFAASALTGTALPVGIVTSSLTSVGTLTSLLVGTASAKVGGIIFAATGTSSAVNTVTETTAFGTGVGSLTLPANSLAAGRVLHYVLLGVAQGSASTLTIKFKIGGTVITSAAAVNFGGATNRDIVAECYFTCTTAGSSGAGVGVGMGRYNTTSFNFIFANSITINTTGTLAVDATGTWSSITDGAVFWTHSFIEIMG